MPLFILYGGEIVLFLLATRIALWFWRSGGLRLPPEPGPPPPGPRGTPQPAPLALGASSAPPPAQEPAPPVRRAA